MFELVPSSTISDSTKASLLNGGAEINMSLFNGIALNFTEFFVNTFSPAKERILILPSAPMLFLTIKLTLKSLNFKSPFNPLNKSNGAF